MADSGFPTGSQQAVALEWVKQQNLSDLTPAEAYALYLRAYQEIGISLQSKRSPR